MSKKLFSKADEQSIDIVDRAIDDLRKLGATIVDPGPEGALFQVCIARYAPELLNSAFTRQYPSLFSADNGGRPQPDQLSMLLSLAFDPSRVPQSLSLRSLRTPAVEGEDKYMMNKYLHERGDANIKTNADLISKARFYQDPNFPDRKQGREAAERATELDTSERLQTRSAFQTLLLQCMQEQRLPDVHGPAAKAYGAARTEREWPLADRLVVHRAARFSGDHRACGLYDRDLGPCARWQRRHTLGGSPQRKLACWSRLHCASV